MTIAKSELIIAYGAGDAESRIFIVKLRDIDHYFTDWLPNTKIWWPDDLVFIFEMKKQI